MKLCQEQWSPALPVSLLGELMAAYPEPVAEQHVAEKKMVHLEVLMLHVQAYGLQDVLVIMCSQCRGISLCNVVNIW